MINACELARHFIQSQQLAGHRPNELINSQASALRPAFAYDEAAGFDEKALLSALLPEEAEVDALLACQTLSLFLSQPHGPHVAIESFGESLQQNTHEEVS